MESSVPEFYQDLLLLLLLQQKNNILFRLPEIKVLHGSKVDSDVIVVCKDTDVLNLMIWTYIKLNITNNWYLKYEHEKFADIRKICSYLGKEGKVKSKGKSRQGATPLKQNVFIKLGKFNK